MTSQNTRRAFGLAVLTFALSSPALAQTMYRCGSVYQDRPCEGAQSGKVVRNYGGTAAAPVAAADHECKERGARSLKVTWAREAGASAEKQSAEARGADERELIAEVYRKRGSAPEVRAAIEADCVAEKQKAAEAAALISAANALKGQRPDPVPVAQPATAANQPDPAAAKLRDEQQAAARAAESKKARCDSLKTSRADIVSQQRAAVSLAQSESLNRRRQDIDSEMGKAGC